MANNRTIFVVKGNNELINDLENRGLVCIEELDNDEINGDSQQSEALYEDHGTPAPDRSSSLILRITTDHRPKNELSGFVIGRNSDKCDIVLDDPSISETHLAVLMNMISGNIVLKNLSKNGTEVAFLKQNTSYLLTRKHVVLNSETVDIKFSDSLMIKIQRYDAPTDWDEYVADDEDGNIPNLAQLGLSTKLQTTIASKRSPVYIKDDLLEKGASGQVFKVVEKYTGDVYAMKVFNNDVARWQERAMLQRLEHDHIVQFKSYMEPEDMPAQLIMEYAKGPTLKEVLNPAKGHRSLGLAEAQEVLHQLLDAVAHVHGEGVAHRDIKPANIVLVGRDPINTKLIDFSKVSDGKLFMTRCGTREYWAPEVRGNGILTNKVDIFAIGGIVLELFGIPFVAENVHKEMEKQLQSLSKDLPIPYYLDLADRMLSRNPSDRPTARECLAHPFFGFNYEFGFVPDLLQDCADLAGIVSGPGEAVTDTAVTQVQVHHADHTVTEATSTPVLGNEEPSASRRSDKDQSESQNHDNVPASVSRRSASVRSNALSQISHGRGQASGALMPDGQDGQARWYPEWDDGLYYGFDNYSENDGFCEDGIPDFTSFGGVPEQRALDGSQSRHSPQQTEQSHRPPSSSKAVSDHAVQSSHEAAPVVIDITDDESDSAESGEIIKGEDGGDDDPERNTPGRGTHKLGTHKPLAHVPVDDNIMSSGGPVSHKRKTRSEERDIMEAAYLQDRYPDKAYRLRIMQIVLMNDGQKMVRINNKRSRN